jgi:hypothetical protein
MEESAAPEVSVFQTKYDEFIEDLLGALPEYTTQILSAKSLDNATRLSRFQEEIKVNNTLSNETAAGQTNPGRILPGVDITDSIWASLSENTRKAIWEYVRILSMCSFLETGFSDGGKPAEWMENAMADIKKNLENIDFEKLSSKFVSFFQTLRPDDGAKSNSTGGGEGGENASPAGFEKLFESGFPKIPERFLKGNIAKLAQEIVKDITPEDLGITPDMIADCEKNPSRAFDVLLQVFTKNPAIIQKTIQKIGKRLQQKFMSGALRTQDIAREAEELMKEFSDNSSFVDMMGNLKSAFGFEDLDLARQAGREGSARLSMVKERLKKKASEKEAKKAAATQATLNASSAAAIAQSEAIAQLLLSEETNRVVSSKKDDKKKIQGSGGKK